MQWASYNITSNSRGIAKLGKPWTQATAATLAPRVLQELRAMAAVADKDESTKEAISPEAWWANCAPQEEQIWQTIYTSMGIWGFGIVGLHASFSGIFLKMFKSHDSEANDILSLRRSDHFMSVAHVSASLRINVEAARMPGMIKKNQWLPCCVNLDEKSGASSCCSGPPLAAKFGPPRKHTVAFCSRIFMLLMSLVSGSWFNYFISSPTTCALLTNQSVLVSMFVFPLTVKPPRPGWVQ